MMTNNPLLYRLGLTPEKVAEMCEKIRPGNRVAFIRGQRSLARERAKLEAAEKFESED